MEWLDKPTKEYAKKKALGMIENIGYPDTIFNSSYFDGEFFNVNIQRGKDVENILEAKRYDVVRKFSKYDHPVIRSH